MAPKDRAPPEHLTFLADAAEGVHSSGLFPLLRGAEARASHLPRVGTSKRPEQNVVDLKHVPSLFFPPRTVESVKIDGTRAKVSGYWLGLTGPMGPLPTHLTEYATYERRYAKTQPFGDFLDVVGGRMLQLFYRSWATHSLQPMPIEPTTTSSPSTWRRFPERRKEWLQMPSFRRAQGFIMRVSSRADGVPQRSRMR